MSYYPNREPFKVLACGCIGQWPMFQGGTIERILCESHPEKNGQVVIREASADDKIEYLATGTVTIGTVTVGTDFGSFGEMQPLPGVGETGGLGASDRPMF